MPILLIIIVVVLIVVTVAWSRVFRRIGWSPWLAALGVVPIVSLGFVLLLAFERWPLEEKVRDLEEQVARLTGGR